MEVTDKVFVANSLADVEELEKQTALLLESMHLKSTKKPKNTATARMKLLESKPRNDKKEKVDKKKAKLQEKTMLSKSLDVGLVKTQNLFTDTRNQSFEIFDNDSPDHSPRQDLDAKSNRVKSISEEISRLKMAQSSEQKYRKMPFEEEYNRVLAERDTFVPAATLSGDDVMHERDRLTRLENSARSMRQSREQEVLARTKYLAEDRSVLKIQSLFRGHIGRIRYKLSCRLRDMNGGSDWIEVRDTQTGDCWYYNKKTAESSWTRPPEMMDKLSSDDTLRKLPAIDGIRTTKEQYSISGAKLPGSGVMGSTSFPVIDPKLNATAATTSTNGYSTAKNLTFDNYGNVLDDYLVQEQLVEAKAAKEVNKILGFDKLLPEHSLSAPDGSFKPQLRATILDALAISRFDSVSSVLGDPRWMEAEKDLFQAADDNAKKATINIVSDTKKVDYSRRPLIAMLTETKKPKQKSKQISVDPNSISRIEDLTVRQIDHPGFAPDNNNTLAEAVDSVELANTNARDQKPTCFGCWSAGLMTKCVLHQDDNVKLKKSQTILLCRNWDLGVMQRRYRAEEIQEIFSQEHTSVRYDPKRKNFSTVFELRHPIYRSQSKLLNKFNARLFLMLKIRRWLRTFSEDVRAGNVKPGRQQTLSRQMREKRNNQQHSMCNRLLRKIRHRLAIPPTTGTSWPERIGEVQYLFSHPDQALGEDVELICVEPTPVPKHLYLPRQYHLSVARPIPMPVPEYKEQDVNTFYPANLFISELSPASWLERLCSGVVRECINAGVSQVNALTPIPGLELLRRTKLPPPCTIKFATLGRKPTPGNMDIGSLPMELLIYQLISTYFPPQYGNFMVMDKSTVSPGVTPEEFISFLSIVMPPLMQEYISRPIEHPLNYRRAPTISINSKVDDSVKHLYGTNRPNQTGEQESHGFRTTAWALHLESEVVTDPLAFIPNADVVTLNTPSANRANNTHADLSYPFCQPSSRDNTTLDFYHLLLTGTMSAPHAQVFTALTIQEAGPFFKNCRVDLPMGRLVVSVYRSWAFTQKEKVQEFKTDDGIPYWYNRETGQTFWERPLHDEEEISALKGGVVLDDEHNEQPTPFQKGEEGLTCRHSQGEWRKLMMNHHETNNEAEIRRKKTSASARIAREKGTLPNVPAGYMEDYDGKIVPIPANGEVEDRPVVRPEVVTGAAQGKLTVDIHSPAKAEQGGGGGFPGIAPLKFDANDSVSSPLTGYKNESLDSPHSQGSLTSRRGSIDTFPKDELFHVGKAPATKQGIAGLDGNVLGGLSEALSKMMTTMLTENSTPQDMIQLGMGMGMALLQSGAVQNIVDDTVNPKTAVIKKENLQSTFQLPPGSVASKDGEELSNHSMVTPAVANVPVGVQPIGVANPNVLLSSTRPLDHKEADRQVRITAAQVTQPLSALDECKRLETVGREKASMTPDDAPLKELTISQPLNAEENVKKKIPLLVYPELSGISTRGAPAPNEYNLHPAAGVGTSFVPKSMSEGNEHVGGTSFLRKTVMPLPVGFFEAIVSKKVAKQEVDYLPKVPNLPQSRTVGRVKPRSAALDWLAVSFDPWSAGKNPLNTEFISALGSNSEKFLDKDANKAAAEFEELKNAVVKDAYVTVNDEEGNAKQRAEISKAQIIAEEFRKLCSLCRHGKFSEVEQLLNRPDWNVPIDHQDARGNTLLHIVAQNGNRRLAKLCLRRGADMNMQNLNGQTPLHFAFGYGFNELGEYFIGKGADDTIRNGENLTCYEGLGARELSYL